MFISFSGNDGSGKSTIIKKLKDIYGENTIIVNEFSGPIINLIKKILQKSNKNNSTNNKGNTSQGFIYFIILYIDTILQTYFYKLFYKNKIILKDRYFEDYIVTLIELKKYNGILRILYNLFPKADLNFYIDTDYKLAFDRRKKQDASRLKSIDFYELKYNTYKNFIEKNKYIKVISNSDNNINDVIKKLKSIIDIKYIFNKKISIVISGIDGAGKTTTINNIKKILLNNNIKNTEIHFYYNYIIVKIIKIFKKVFGFKEKSIEEQYKCSLETEKKAKKSNKSIFWIIFVLLDSFIQYLWIKIIGFNKVKLIDRFFPDYIVSWDFIGVKYNKNIFKYLPKAKNYFLLVAPPKILYERKPEHSLDFFEKCYNDYLKLSKEYDICLIDTSKHSEEEVVNLIINKLKEKNGL